MSAVGTCIIFLLILSYFTIGCDSVDKKYLKLNSAWLSCVASLFPNESASLSLSPNGSLKKAMGPCQLW